MIILSYVVRLLPILWIISFFMGFQPQKANAAVIWQIGNDDGATPTSDMDPEYQADDFFYLHAGDYRAIRGYTGISTTAFGENRATPEVLADGAISQDGFERALTTGDPATNVFFQLTEQDLSLGSLKFSLDLLKPLPYSATPPGPSVDSPTDISIYFNGHLIGSYENIVQATLIEITFANSTVDAALGSNVISLVRTGDPAPDGWSSAYVSMDYLRLESVPEPTRLLLSAFALLATISRRSRK